MGRPSGWSAAAIAARTRATPYRSGAFADAVVSSRPAAWAGAGTGQPYEARLPDREHGRKAARAAAADAKSGATTTGRLGRVLDLVAQSVRRPRRVVRFTPRAVDRTDAEIFWLVHPDAKEGKDYDVKRIQALWGNTYREDRWICENQHLGVLSSAITSAVRPAVRGAGRRSRVDCPVVHAGSRRPVRTKTSDAV